MSSHSRFNRSRRRGEVGDVAVDKQLAGVQAHDLIGGYPAIGAADPQIFGPLLPLQPLEEAGIDSELALGPGAVVFLQLIEHEMVGSLAKVDAALASPL